MATHETDQLEISRAARIAYAEAHQAKLEEYPFPLDGQDDPTLEMPIPEESLRNVPEMPDLTPAEQQVLEAITLPENHQKRLHQQFQAAISEEVETCIDPGDADLIKTVASIIEWEWFAQRGDSLPDGIVMNTNGELIPRTKYAAANVVRVRHHLEVSVLESTSKYREGLMDALDMDSKIREAFAAIGRESEIYRVLHAIASDTPESEDMPLPLARRMIREAQIEDDVRRRHSLAPSDTLGLHPNAHREFNKGVCRLDDETEKRKTLQTLDGRERLLAFLVDEYNEYDDDPGVPLITSFYLNENGDICGRGIDGEEVYIGGGALHDFSYCMSESISKPNRLESIADSEFIPAYLLTNLLDPEKLSQPVLKVLYESAYGFSPADVRIGGDIVAEVLTYIRGVQSDIVGRLPYEDGTGPTWVKTSENPSIEVHDLQGLKKEQNTIIGLTRGKAYLAANHLVMGGNPRQSEYPQTADDYDIRIELGGSSISFNTYGKDFAFRKGVPFIPGFELVAIDKSDRTNQFYFKRAEVDPYNGSAEVMLDPGGIQAVINQCQEIGFTALADKLRGTREVSLADMAAFVSEVSDYTFEQKYYLTDFFGEKREFAAEDLKKLVDETGRLQVQCTGAATFLGYLLKTALPGSHATTIGGNVIEPDGYISAAGHAQVMVSHAGEQYILDATPSLGSEYGLTSVRGGASGGAYRNQAAAERKLPDNIKHADSQDITRNQQKNGDELTVVDTTAAQNQREANERTVGVGERTKMLFRAHFNMSQSGSDDKLYERILKLKKDADPIRKTLELLLRSENQDITADLQSAQEYIANLKKAEPVIFKRIGIPHYNQTMLSSLESILQDLKLKDDPALQES